MKRLSFILAAVLLVLGLAQCKKEKTQAQGSGETIVQQVTVGASCNGGNSKVDGQIIGNALKLTWDEGDVIEVGIPEKSGLSTLTLSSPAGETTGKFTGTITGQTGDKLTFLYKAANSKYYLDNEGNVITDEEQFMNQNGKLEKTDDNKASDKNSILDRLCAYVQNIDFIASDAAEYSADLEVPYAILKLDLSYFGTTAGNKVSIMVDPYEIASVTGVTNAADNPYYVAVPAYGSREYTFSGNGKTAKVTWKLDKNIYYTKSDGNGGSTGEAIVVAPATPDYVCFEALANNSSVVLSAMGMVPPSDFKYSTDGVNWDDFNGTVNLNVVGSKCYLKTTVERKAIEASFYGMYDVNCNFSGSGNVKVSGNIMTLLNGDNPATTMTSDYAGCFSQLFQGNNNVSDASELVLPATTLASNCYESMFSNCESLTKAPKLPATTLASNCYKNMFKNCTSLVDASSITLSAPTLVDNCYYYMFQGCAKLEKAPVSMSATTLGSNSCNGMFDGCSKLETVPDMSSISTVASSSCDAMFKNCTSLVTAPVLNATTLGTNCYNQMFYGCTSLTAAPALPATTLEYGCYDNMFKGCTNLVTAPVLEAQTLKPYCYNAMFADCSKLSSVTMMATAGFSEENCLNDWLDEAGNDSSVSSRTVYVASGMVDAVKATVPNDWKTGVQVKP